MGTGRGVPGVVYREGGWEGYTGYPPVTLPGTHIQSYSSLKAYLGPNEGNSGTFHEVS